MTPTPADILLVEDDPMTRLIMRSLLEERGYSVREVEAGQEALDFLTKKATDLVILDYYLPDMKGSDVISELNRIAIRLPIIVVTGYDDPKLAQRVLAAGAMRFVHKDSECLYLRKLPAIVEEALAPNG